MKFIKITTIPTVDLPTKKMWVTSNADAGKARKALVDAGYKRTAIVTEEVEIELNKVGMLAFLNGDKA
jgi:hypothetical protein